MADDLLGLFFDPAKPDSGLTTAWLVCQRCLHGNLRWHLRVYVSKWNFPDDNVSARELEQCIKNYWPPELRPYLQDGVIMEGKKHTPALTLGPSARGEIRDSLDRLRKFLIREITDEDAAECQIDYTNPPGFECLNVWN